MEITVIGAGLGGLSTACLLAAEGHDVSVYEKNAQAGGKISHIKKDGFYFDTGPSLLTLPFLLKELFLKCGANLDDYLHLIPLNPLCKYFFKNGETFLSFSDKSAALKEVEQLAPQDVKAYSKFLTYSENLYHKTSDAFIYNPLLSFQDLKHLSISDFFGIDAFTTIAKRIDKEFTSPHLRQFFKRFATYNGSSPFQAPATLNVIPHVELNKGGYYVKGGMYEIVEALLELASSLGVRIHYKSEIKSLQVKNKKAVGLELSDNQHIKSDLIIANSDVNETLIKLLPQRSISERKLRKTEKLEPSCSGFVLLLGINRKYEQLEHHNIFFSEDYRREFEQIFQEKVMPDDPTIYITNTSKSDTGHAPEGCTNLFILVNAPYLSSYYNWEEKRTDYEQKVIQELEKRGLENISDHIVYQKSITPKDFYQKYYSNKGSIYGTSSNGMLAAFNRPRNKSREIERLYFTGGSSHPGGGIPLVIQSAFNVQELINRYEKR